MTKKTLERDKKYIETHVGEIPTSKMILFYERYLHGSDEYGLGVEFENMAYLIYRKHIPQKYCSCQTDHQKGIQYLRFRPHEWGAKEIANARAYEYEYSINPTDRCAYTSVSLDTKDIGDCVEVSATNFSKFDIQSVGVRSVFMKNGRAVAFDTVNIADAGITFHGGSTNSQIIGTRAGDYDDMIITYTTVSNHSMAEDL